MKYLEVLGQVLREARVAAGLSREACSQVLNRDHLAKVEQGRQALSVIKLKALCDYLDVPLSLVFLAVEARLSAKDIDEYRTLNEQQFRQHRGGGWLSGVAHGPAMQGVRGKRAEENRTAIEAMQSEGLAKMEVVRELGLSRSTVDRYWMKR